MVTMAQAPIQWCVSEKVLEDSCRRCCCDATVASIPVAACEVLLCFVIVLGWSALCAGRPVAALTHNNNQSRCCEAHKNRRLLTLPVGVPQHRRVLRTMAPV